MRENRLSGGVGGVAGNSRHPDPINNPMGLDNDSYESIIQQNFYWIPMG